MAKVSREFKNKRDNKSRAQTGTQQIQNPDYVTAMASYQKAMAEFQRAQISSAIPKLCRAGVARCKVSLTAWRTPVRVPALTRLRHGSLPPAR